MSRRARGWLAAALFAAVVCLAPARAQEEEQGLDVAVEVTPLEVTVGDHLSVRITVTLPPATRMDPPQLGPSIGPFAVLDGGWGEAESLDGGERRVWSGTLVSYRTGEMELPPLRIVVEGEDGTRGEAETDPVSVRVRSVLDAAVAEEGPPEIADLKPPAGLPPDFGALIVAAGGLGLLLVVAALLWWLHRRYAARLAAVPAPDDPFHRRPPHEWIYAELQKLLERRLAEQGEVALFFSELSRIVKRYLGGRFRVELLERTTAEVPERLLQAGAGRDAIEAVRELLVRCDLVKFAREAPGADRCREAIESAYRIVDATKPRPAKPAEPVQGAA